MAVQAYKLGTGAGTIRDNGDGTASYYASFGLGQPSFHVRIADVTGFALSSGWVFRILGNGVELASTPVARFAPHRIEAWFRAHPDFGRNADPSPAPAPPQLDGRLIADELTKLAGLRDAGVLTDEEFDNQKARLLG
jgi:hypothetical protein